MSGAQAWDREFGSYAEFYEHAYGQHITARRMTSGLAGTLLEASQSAGDWSDAPTPDLTFNWLPSRAARFSIDLGAGRFSGQIRTGECILVAPNAGSTILIHEAHVVRVLSVPFASLRSMAGERGGALPTDGNFGALHAGVLRDRKVFGLLEALWQESGDGGAYGAMFVDGILLQLTGTLLRLQQSQKSGSSNVPRGGLAPWQERRVTEVLTSNLAADPSLADLASIVGLSPEHFCRAFKASTGLPPHAWLVARRVERARELLDSTGLAVEEIAARVGYAEPSHLARMFRRAHGLSPTEYRRERRS